MLITEDEIEKFDQELNTLQPKQIIKAAFEKFENIAISFSGAEDVVLIDLALKFNKNVSVFC